MQFAIEWPEGRPSKAEWDIKGDVEGRWQQVEKLRVTNDAGTPQMLVANDWQGLIPTKGSLDIDAKILALQLQDRLNALASDVQWISGIRVRPSRIATYGGGAARTLQPDGENAVQHLVAAQTRSLTDPLIEAVLPFFQALGEQLVLDSPARGLWQVLLHPTTTPGVRVNLCDTGEGYAQVLPVLVALARACTGGPRLLCLEQPELHLHTRAQAALAKALVQSALHASSPRILVETHSEVLLMSVQLAIAKGEIPADQVRVYWVESRGDGTSDAVAVDFDAMGRPQNSTLVGAFKLLGDGGELLLLTPQRFGQPGHRGGETGERFGDLSRAVVLIGEMLLDGFNEAAEAFVVFLEPAEWLIGVAADFFTTTPASSGITAASPTDRTSGISVHRCPIR